QLVPVIADDIAAVEAEIVGIGPHEADRVGIARQLLEAALFYRANILRADAQLTGDIIDVLLGLLAPAAQQRADTPETTVIRHVGFAAVEEIGFALCHPWSLRAPCEGFGPL